MSQIIELSQVLISEQENLDTDYEPDWDEQTRPIGEDGTSNAFHKDTVVENEILIKESMPDKILFSLEEAATLLGVSYDYVRNLANQNRIATKPFGKRKMIHIKELSRIITEGVN